MSKADVKALGTASRDLLWPSESDFPIEAFSWPGGETLDAAKLLEMAGLPAESPVRTTTPDKLFKRVVAEPDEDDPEGRERAERFRKLKVVLQKRLTDIQVFRVGEIEIDVYIVGKAKDGKWVGIKTRVVET